MRGHIRKRGKDSYSIVLSLGLDSETGKRKQEWISIKGSKKDAEKRLSELLTQLDTGAFVKPGKITLGEFSQQWLSDYVWPNLSPATARVYELIIKKHLVPALGNVALNRLRPEVIQHYLKEKLGDNLSAKTVRHHYITLHGILQSAVKWGLLARNPGDAVTPPRVKRPELNTWNEDDIHTFLEAAKDSPYYALFFLALYTGMRRNELLGVRWGDIDFMLGQIHVSRSLCRLRSGEIDFRPPKTASSRRTIDLGPSPILALKEHKEKQRLERVLLGMVVKDSDLVFSHFDGKPLMPDSVTHAWIKLVRRAGVKPIRLHDARHTHASLMLKQGIHPKIVQERLGHASIQITLDTYSHVAPGLQEAAAKRFDELLNPTPGSKPVKNFG